MDLHLTQYAPQFFVMSCVMLVFTVIFAIFEWRKMRRQARAAAEKAESRQFLETAGKNAMEVAAGLLLISGPVKITGIHDRRRKTSRFADVISPKTEPIIPIEQVFPRH